MKDCNPQGLFSYLSVRNDDCLITPSILLRRMEEDSAGMEEEPRPGRPRRVIFHSATQMPKGPDLTNVSTCLEYMKEGSSLLKIRSNSRQYYRYYFLEENLSEIRWFPSSKKSSESSLKVENIREIRVGRTTSIFRSVQMSSNYSDDCTFSIIHGDHMDSLDLVANSAEIARMWVTGLHTLLGISSGLLLKNEERRDQWLRKSFEEADTLSKGWLSVRGTIQLLKKLNRHFAFARIRQKLNELDRAKRPLHHGRIEFQDFLRMFKELNARPDISSLLLRFGRKDYLTLEDLQLFLAGEQEMTEITQENCRKILNESELYEDAKRNGYLSTDGFIQYLLSDEGSILKCCRVVQDMTQPLTHYFISSSHNKFSGEDSLTLMPIVEEYIRAFKSGCRFITVCCKDDAGGPMVYNDNFTASLSSVLSAINSNAFCASEFPLLIHLDCQCKLGNQEQIVVLLKNIFGDKLFSEQKSKPVIEMSPEQLKRKILLLSNKSKASYHPQLLKLMTLDIQEVPIYNLPRKEISIESLSSEWESDSSSERNCKCCEKDMGRRQSIPAVLAESKAEEIKSLTTEEGIQLANSCCEDFVKYTNQKLVQITCTNKQNPQQFWTCGCQLVTMNLQIEGEAMDVYRGWFLQNGGCGFVLKPFVMRQSPFGFSPKLQRSGRLAVKFVKLTFLSGQQLPKPRLSTSKGQGIDPYISLQIYGTDDDCYQMKTKTIEDAGNCPIFDESFEFSLRCPDLALIRFLVADDKGIGDDFIGQFTIPFNCIRKGYRHIPLLDRNGESLDGATLFVHVQITNRFTGNLGNHSYVKSTLPNKPCKLRNLDRLFKSAHPIIEESITMLHFVQFSIDELCLDFGLMTFTNIIQCFRILINRIVTSKETVTCKIKDIKSFPILEYQGTISPVLNKSILIFEKVLIELHYYIKNSENILKQLEEIKAQALQLQQNYDKAINLKGNKLLQAKVNFSLNIQLLLYHEELMKDKTREARNALCQVLSFSSVIGNLVRRSPRTTQSSPPSKAPSPSEDTPSTVSPVNIAAIPSRSILKVKLAVPDGNAKETHTQENSRERNTKD